MTLQKDLREFVELLNSHDVRYMIVGGYAVAFHGHPRMTGDIDFFLEPSEQNAAKILRLLTEFGFGGLGLTATDFLTPEFVIQLGYPPNRIDLLSSISGSSFEEAWADRVVAEVDGVTAIFAGRATLLANKAATGRPKDLADIAALR